MKIRPLFDKYQKYLVAFANTSFGKSYLGIRADYPIVKVAPDGWHQHLEKRELRGTFYPRSKYLKKFRVALESMALIEEGLKFRFNDLRQGFDFVIAQYLGFTNQSFLPQIHLSTLTAYPDPDPETTTVDGNVRRITSAAYATLRSGAGEQAFPSTAAVDALWTRCDTVSNQLDRLSRYAILFDGNSMGAGATVNSGTVSIRATGKSSALGGDIVLVSSNPFSNTNLTVPASDDDYAVARWGSTDLSTRVAYSAISTAAYHDFTLNASGLSNVSVTSISKFGVRDSYDVDNSAPTWGSGAESYITVNCADTADTTTDPKMVIDYTAAAAGGPDINIDIEKEVSFAPELKIRP